MSFFENNRQNLSNPRIEIPGEPTLSAASRDEEVEFHVIEQAPYLRPKVLGDLKLAFDREPPYNWAKEPEVIWEEFRKSFEQSMLEGMFTYEPTEPEEAPEIVRVELSEGFAAMRRDEVGKLLAILTKDEYGSQSLGQH